MYAPYFITSSLKEVVLGFDIEWKVTYVKGDYCKTSVLQLCPNAHNCYIFQLFHMDGKVILKRWFMQNIEN